VPSATLYANAVPVFQMSAADLIKVDNAFALAMIPPPYGWFAFGHDPDAFADSPAAYKVIKPPHARTHARNRQLHTERTTERRYDAHSPHCTALHCIQHSTAQHTAVLCLARLGPARRLAFFFTLRSPPALRSHFCCTLHAHAARLPAYAGGTDDLCAASPSLSLSLTHTLTHSLFLCFCSVLFCAFVRLCGARAAMHVMCSGIQRLHGRDPRVAHCSHGRSDRCELSSVAG
jgi:hypothetical protein